MAAASSSKVALVTGASQGIGTGVVSRIARLYPQSYFGTTPSPTPLTLYFTARNVERGQESFENLRKELGPNKVLVEDGGPTTLKFHQLDITDPKSREAMAATIKKEGGLDLLVNNAGIALNGFDGDVVHDTLGTNYYATRDITRLLLPHMRDGGRIVTVASMAGKLNGYSDDITKRFKAVQTEQEADQLMKEFEDSVKAGDHDQKGWKSAAYSVSKAGIIAWHVALARELKASGSSIVPATCCPGYVSTRMTKHKGVRTVEEGAMTPSTLALDNVGDAGGSFWENSRPSVWG